MFNSVRRLLRRYVVWNRMIKCFSSEITGMVVSSDVRWFCVQQRNMLSKRFGCKWTKTHSFVHPPVRASFIHPSVHQPISASPPSHLFLHSSSYSLYLWLSASAAFLPFIIPCRFPHFFPILSPSFSLSVFPFFLLFSISSCFSPSSITP